VSELPTRIDDILLQLRQMPVHLEKHGRPVAVLVEPARFHAMQDCLAAVDGFLAERRERSRRAPSKELEKILRKLRKAQSKT